MKVTSLSGHLFLLPRLKGHHVIETKGHLRMATTGHLMSTWTYAVVGDFGTFLSIVSSIFNRRKVSSGPCFLVISELHTAVKGMVLIDFQEFPGTHSTTEERAYYLKNEASVALVALASFCTFCICPSRPVYFTILFARLFWRKCSTEVLSC